MRPGGRSICSVAVAWYSGVLVSDLTTAAARHSSATDSSIHLCLSTTRSSALRSSESSACSLALSRSRPVCSIAASRSDRAVVERLDSLGKN